ncbi:phiSA1p31-related protein [Streptomyces sp. NBC_00335]|uniref:phiSA1p31-related protein n=1 Tax=unclassified Streptomyces TaxID=2593676 RepID=UPI0022504383|nr:MULTISPECIES: phiSA1p31-related protein [unclassified Streptomyces]MCX5407453.1 phiSA1p31-related protein [Streptomyces sp. NBC_00086]
MTTYLHDGVEFDLDCEFVAVTGVIWMWTGGWSPAAEPMLRSDGPGVDLPLPDAYYYHGPLIPRRPKLKTLMSAAFTKSLDAGYVEDVESYGARIDAGSL